MAGAVLGEGQVSLFVVGAVLGEGQVSLFVVGAVLVSLCVVGAVLGEVQVALLVVGAGLGEIWKDSRSAKCCIFQYKPFVRSAKSNLGCVAGCGLTQTVSERSRNGLGSAAHWNFCSIGVLELNFVIRSSTGVVLCSTGVVLE